MQGDRDRNPFQGKGDSWGEGEGEEGQRGKQHLNLSYFVKIEPCLSSYCASRTKGMEGG